MTLIVDIIAETETWPGVGLSEVSWAEGSVANTGGMLEYLWRDLESS